jgi:antagonist of KipI
MSDIVTVRAGLLTTVQDGGRWGQQHHGVPVSGGMDPFSMRLVNLLAGNADDEATLEVTLQGPELRFERDAIAVIGGADLSAVVATGGTIQRVSLWRPFRVPSGASLRFGERRSLARAYVAVSGGLDVPAVLGSRAASAPAQLPGLAGRALRVGDVLPIGNRATSEPIGVRLSHAVIPPAPIAGRAAVRFIWGPDEELFSPGDRATFARAEYRVAIASNRMGYRLDGPPVHARGGGGQLLSEATPIGSIQVPPLGQPILLMADRQTTGGYPRIGTVISADLGVAGQLAPGETIAFVPCDVEEAVKALREQERALVELGASR